MKCNFSAIRTITHTNPKTESENTGCSLKQRGAACPHLSLVSLAIPPFHFTNTNQDSQHGSEADKYSSHFTGDSNDAHKLSDVPKVTK